MLCIFVETHLYLCLIIKLRISFY